MICTWFLEAHTFDCDCRQQADCQCRDDGSFQSTVVVRTRKSLHHQVYELATMKIDDTTHAVLHRLREKCQMNARKFGINFAIDGRNRRCTPSMASRNLHSSLVTVVLTTFDLKIAPFTWPVYTTKVTNVPFTSMFIIGTASVLSLNALYPRLPNSKALNLSVETILLTLPGNYHWAKRHCFGHCYWSTWVFLNS